MRSIWVFREALEEHELIDELLAQLNAQIDAVAYNPHQGQIVHASMVSAPRQRNSREGNTKIKQGEIPEGWEEIPAMRTQKNVDARWTKKHDQTHYGYTNHVSIDRKHKPAQEVHSMPAGNVVLLLTWTRQVRISVKPRWHGCRWGFVMTEIQNLKVPLRHQHWSKFAAVLLARAAGRLNREKKDQQNPDQLLATAGLLRAQDQYDRRPPGQGQQKEAEHTEA